MPERQFILSCESTVDLPYAYVAGRDIPILFYTYMIDGETFVDDMGRDPDSIPAFYRKLDAGALPTTAQLNEVQYEEFLEPLLQRGDVLHHRRPLRPRHRGSLLPRRPPRPGEVKKVNESSGGRLLPLKRSGDRRLSYTKIQSNH